MDPMNGLKDDLVFYLNIIMDNQGTVYSRERYTLIDLMEQQGGLTQCTFIFAFLLVAPFTYKRHELQIFIDHENKYASDVKFDHQLRNSYLKKL